MTLLPTPVQQRIGLDWSTRKPERGRSFHYPVPGATDGAIVLLTISHFASSKALVATATPGRVDADGTVTYVPTDGVNFATEYVGRYSDKARDAFVAQTLGDLEARLTSGSPTASQTKLREVFAAFLGEQEAPQAVTPESLAAKGEDPAGAITYVTEKYPHLSSPVCSCGERIAYGYTPRSVSEDIAARHLADKHRAAVDAYSDVVQPDFAFT